MITFDHNAEYSSSEDEADDKKDEFDIDDIDDVSWITLSSTFLLVVGSSNNLFHSYVFVSGSEFCGLRSNQLIIILLLYWEHFLKVVIFLPKICCVNQD